MSKAKAKTAATTVNKHTYTNEGELQLICDESEMTHLHFLNVAFPNGKAGKGAEVTLSSGKKVRAFCARNFDVLKRPFSLMESHKVDETGKAYTSLVLCSSQLAWTESDDEDLNF